MERRTTRPALIGIALAAISMPLVARAQAKTPREWALEWEAPSSVPAGCADSSAFKTMVERRAERDVRWRSGSAGSGADISVQLASIDSARVRATVRVRTSDPEATTRVLEGSCDEALSALSLIVAIAIERERQQEQGTPVESEPPAVQTARPSVPAKPPERARSSSEGFRAAFAVAADIGGAYIGGAGVGFRLGGSFALSFDVENAHEPRWAPGARLGASHTFPLSIATPLGLGGVSFVEGDVEAWLAVLPLGSRVTLAPSVTSSFGVLRADAGSVAGATSRTRPWITLGPSVRTRVGLAARFALVLSVGLRIPMLQERFFFEPNTTLLDAPAIVPAATLSPEWSIF